LRDEVAERVITAVGCLVSIENILPAALIDAPRNQAANDLQGLETDVALQQVMLGGERLLNARQVAESLGVSERWVRDHTTRRSPKIRGIKLGTLMHYRRADIEIFMEELDTQATSRRNRFGV
jgi:hypothetical protein